MAKHFFKYSEEELQRLKVALAVISGRYHPSRMAIENLNQLGYDINWENPGFEWPSEDDVLSRCEGVVYKYITGEQIGE